MDVTSDVSVKPEEFSLLQQQNSKDSLQETQIGLPKQSQIMVQPYIVLPPRYENTGSMMRTAGDHFGEFKRYIVICDYIHINKLCTGCY